MEEFHKLKVTHMDHADRNARILPPAPSECDCKVHDLPPWRIVFLDWASARFAQSYRRAIFGDFVSLGDLVHDLGEKVGWNEDVGIWLQRETRGRIEAERDAIMLPKEPRKDRSKG